MWLFGSGLLGLVVGVARRTQTEHDYCLGASLNICMGGYGMSANDKDTSFQDGGEQVYSDDIWEQQATGAVFRTDADRPRANRDNHDGRNTSLGAKYYRGTVQNTGSKYDTRVALAILLLVPLIFAGGIFILALASVLAVFVAPVLNLAEKLLDSDEIKNYPRAWYTTFLSLSAYGLTAVVATGMIYVLGRYLMHGLLGPLALEIETAAEILWNNGDMSGVPVVGALLAIQLPALAAMALVLYWQYERLYSGLRGSLLGIVTGVAMLIATALVTLAFCGAVAAIY